MKYEMDVCICLTPCPFNVKGIDGINSIRAGSDACRKCKNFIYADIRKKELKCKLEKKYNYQYDLNKLAKEIHQYAIDKGWWRNKKRNMAEILCLIHSEVSEALEDYRNNKMKTYFVDNKPCGFPSELADIIIRVLDLFEHLKIDINKEIMLKMEYNKKRSYRHGGKKC